MRIATLCGMSAVFSALFGTPLTATIFALEVISVGVFYYSALVPCIVASLAALAISNAFGIAPTQFTFALTAVPKLLLLRVAALAAVCSLMSILFCVTIHGTERLFASRIPNTWLRIASGGAIVVVLSLLVGTGDYNGAGMDVITRAIEGGQAAPDAFFWKLLFTAVTIGSGFKGGEVVPTFFIGATLGCVLGGLLGIPAGFAAALGLVCVFCGAVNCPIASMVLSIELFGAGQLVYFALACGIAYMLSGYFGLYSSQKILYSSSGRSLSTSTRNELRPTRTASLGSRRKGTRSAAAHAPSVHVCGPGGIFSAVHAAGENDWNFFASADAKLCEAFGHSMPGHETCPANFTLERII